ncbi:hypothetical protein D9M72_624890 [compost metagenome]
MDIQGDFLQIQLLDASLPEEVSGSLALHQHVQALVGGTKARAQGQQAIGLESCLVDGTRRLGLAVDPGQQVLQIVGDPGFHRAAVQLPQHSAPEPLAELVVDARLQPALFKHG